MFMIFSLSWALPAAGLLVLCAFLLSFPQALFKWPHPSISRDSYLTENIEAIDEVLFHDPGLSLKRVSAYMPPSKR